MSQGHVDLKGSSRPRKHEAERVGDVDPQSRVEVTVTLRGPDLPAPDPAQTISRNEYGERYGASSADIEKVKEALQQFGLAVEEVSSAARSMRVSGTAAEMEKAFHPGLGMYRAPDHGEFRGREESLQVPADLDGLVTGVFGFDERRVARRAGKTGFAPVATEAAAGTGTPLTPTDLEERYKFPAGDGSGQQVGIAEFGGTYFPGDLKAFCQRHGIPEAKVHVVDVGMKAPTIAEIEAMSEGEREAVLGASGEVMMDVEIIAGLCPGAEIFVYFAPFDEKGWIDLLNRVIQGDPAAPVSLSVSWGLAEDTPEWSQAATREIDLRLQAAAQIGVTVCVSSGDDGTGDQLEDGKSHVNFPSSSANVLSVGGTMLDGEDEVVWWQSPGRRTGQGGGSTGGGVSTVFKRPSWQDVNVSSLNPGSIDGRVLPDITALAGPPYYDLVFEGRVAPNGGTSASAPLWAALLARIAAAGKAPAFMAPLLYRKDPSGKSLGADACVDIVKGENPSHPQPGIGYKAEPGFDAVSGWGTPDGEKLLESLP
ncbi:MAG TPA: S53 family peptidase [Solirubrobacterales bacterium]|jgi:kumamolisin|nr:S53 family peptidase [Solirubrobacterales bacterium]